PSGVPASGTPPTLLATAPRPRPGASGSPGTGYVARGTPSRTGGTRPPPRPAPGRRRRTLPRPGPWTAPRTPTPRQEGRPRGKRHLRQASAALIHAPGETV